MHFRSMLFVDLPQIQPDPEWEKQVQSQVKELEAQHPGKTLESALFGFYLGRLKSVETAFGMELTKQIHKTMERFCYETDNPEYLEFEDKTEDYKKDFEGTVDCVVMPDGEIKPIDAYPLWRQFIIKDGKVFQREAGKLRHPKRTKKAKKMKALPAYPRKSLYASFESFVADEGGILNEETGQYGVWYNPYGMCDWYSIGGRWPEMFLVKLDCQEYSCGEVTPADYPAPEGYRWVACARKKDIQWEAMRAWRNQQAEEQYHKLKEMFDSGDDHGNMCRIAEDGLYHWGKVIYRKDQTLEEYLDEFGFTEKWKYPISICGIFIDEIYYSEGETLFDDDGKPVNHLSWQEVMDNLIDDADDETVFVGIDYHM